jgi:glycosyltransferase involved in cell wall biosynthesis
MSRSPIIYNWTASPELIKLGEDRAYSTNVTQIRVLFLGWLEREKGIFELLQACEELQGTVNFNLTIAGNGHAMLEANTYVNVHGLSSIVSFLGWVHGDDLNRVLASSDVLVLPSWAEGFPNALVEAMAAGLAVVTTMVGAIPSVLTDGREALLVPPRDGKALTKALRKVINDVDFRENLQRRGHEFARENFTIEPAVEKLTTVINKAILLNRGNINVGNTT